jgi:hypothetical protein
VHVTPTRITLGGYSDGAGFGEGDPAVPLQLSVACGPEPASGTVELLVPDGLLAEIDGELRRHRARDGRARLAVLAPGQAHVLRPRPLLAGGPAHGDLIAGFAAVLRPRAVSP